MNHIIVFLLKKKTHFVKVKKQLHLSEVSLYILKSVNEQKIGRNKPRVKRPALKPVQTGF